MGSGESGAGLGEAGSKVVGCEECAGCWPKAGLCWGRGKEVARMTEESSVRLNWEGDVKVSVGWTGCERRLEEPGNRFSRVGRSEQLSWLCFLISEQ